MDKLYTGVQSVLLLCMYWLSDIIIPCIYNTIFLRGRNLLTSLSNSDVRQVCTKYWNGSHRYLWASWWKINYWLLETEVLCKQYLREYRNQSIKLFCVHWAACHKSVLFLFRQTYVAKVLIAINPFKHMSGLYSEEKIKNYRDDLSDELTPHLYAIGKF